MTKVPIFKTKCFGFCNLFVFCSFEFGASNAKRWLVLSLWNWSSLIVANKWVGVTHYHDTPALRAGITKKQVTISKQISIKTKCFGFCNFEFGASSA